MAESGVIKGFKVFNPDWTCSPNGKVFQYEVGKTYEKDVKPKVYKCGFYFCEKAADCFKFHKFSPENKVAEVLALGDVDSDGEQSCTNKIQIVREIPWAELLEIVNTGKWCVGLGNSGYHNSGNSNSGNWNSGNWNSGNRNSGNRNSGNGNSGNSNSGNWNSGNWNSGNRNSGNRNSGNGNSGNRNSGNWNSGNSNSGNSNSGNRNSGDCNSGDRNSGDWNSGDRNSGDRNSGDWNSGDWNKCSFSNGCFNTKSPKIYLFNKPSPWTYEDWLVSEARSLLNQIPGDVLEYRCLGDMTDEEKAEHPEAKTTGGYLKKLDNSECALIWWRKLDDRQKAVITALPNFDKTIFKEITGIDVNEG